MSVFLSKDEIRCFPKVEYPNYYIYEHRPLSAFMNRFISAGAIFLDNPLAEEEFQFGYQIKNSYPTPQSWDVVKSELYQGDSENICSGFIISWSQPSENKLEALTNEEIRQLSFEESPDDIYLSYYMPLATIERAGSFPGSIIDVPDPMILPSANPGHRFNRNYPNPRNFEVVYSEIYRGDHNNICSGVLVCWYQEI